MSLAPLLLVLGLLAMPAWGAAPVVFGDALHKKFHHERCLQCHQFGSRKHNGRGFGSHRSRLDYTGLGAADTCRLIQRNMGVVDAPARLIEHLLHDSRIRWALDSGMTPAGRFPNVPGGYEEWVRDVRAWVEGGMLCE